MADGIKIKILGWAGHIIRMGDERIPKKVLNGKFHNLKPVGKPSTIREDVIRRKTSQILRIQVSRRRAEDREEWRHNLRKARLRRGCSTIHGMEYTTSYINNCRQNITISKNIKYLF
jgi:hypothetical protein